MTEDQWQANKDHLEGHITWPATKEQIIAACNDSSDIPADVKTDVQSNLPDGTYNSPEEVKSALVTG